MGLFSKKTSVSQVVQPALKESSVTEVGFDEDEIQAPIASKQQKKQTQQVQQPSEEVDEYQEPEEEQAQTEEVDDSQQASSDSDDSEILAEIAKRFEYVFGQIDIINQRLEKIESFLFRSK